MEEHFQIRPIGVTHSSLKTRQDAKDCNTKENVGEIEIFEEYQQGLSDLGGFSHIVVIFWMHKAKFESLKVRPIFHPERLRGVFATRHPDRPNPIGITIAELIEVKGNKLEIKGFDMLDGTPVLDIKPYTEYYIKEPYKRGWLSGKKFPWSEERKSK
jgi:tRNA-Thr(GGU) m(6)t(6)A37 methyltransferase TsaA